MDTFPATLLALAITAPILVGLILLAGRDLPRSFSSGFAFGGFAIPAVLGPWLLVLWSDPITLKEQFQSEGFWGFGFALNGLSAPLLAMTSLVGLAAGIKALTQEVEGRNTYLGLILFMLGGTLGVFGTNHLVGVYFFQARSACSALITSSAFISSTSSRSSRRSSSRFSGVAKAVVRPPCRWRLP